MNVHVLPSGPIETNAYLLAMPSRGEAVLIDAPQDVWPAAEELLKAEGCRLSGLWLTHGHWDHTQGAAEVVRNAKVPVYAHLGDRSLIENPELMRPLLPPGIEIEPVTVDRWLEDGEVIDALGGKVSVRHVPGHSRGSLMFYFAGSGNAFPGDVLFRGSVGRTDLPGGDFAELEESIRRCIYTLPGTTRVYPGHGGSTSVGEERSSNPHVRA